MQQPSFFPSFSTRSRLFRQGVGARGSGSEPRGPLPRIRIQRKLE